MQMKPMRWVDHWVGLPLCFLLGLFSVMARKVLGTRRRVITGRGELGVLKFFGMGSIIQASPLLRAIRKQYPQGRLVFVTFKTNESLVRRLNICDELLIIRTDHPLQFLFDVLRTVARLHSKHLEAVIDLEFFSKFSTLLSFASRAAIRVGFHLNDFWRHSLITHPIYFNYFRHIAEVYKHAGRQLNVEIDDYSLSNIEVDIATRQKAKALLEKYHWSPDILTLGININAGELSLTRRWPLEYWKELIEILMEQHSELVIVLTGAGYESAYVSSLVGMLPENIRSRIINTAGNWSLMEFIAGLSLFNGFVTNDSGPMHLAATVGLPTVSLWGPGRPDFYAPRTNNNKNIYLDYPCSPCLYMFTTFEGMWCKNEGWCMRAIAPGLVLDAVNKMLAENRKTN